MKLFFAKSKGAAVFCGIAALAFTAAAMILSYYALGNLKCAEDAPILISESGNGIFMGFYLISAAYCALTVLALILAVYFIACAVIALRRAR